MNNKDFNKIDNIIGEYKYGFTTDVKKEVVNIGKGIKS